jgi:cell division protein FtsI/penicillin-binding protein 2
MDESKSFETLPIRTRLTDEEVARFIAHRYRFPGVEIKARLFRQYPGGAFASHILGYIGRITDGRPGEDRGQGGGRQLPRHRALRQDRAGTAL